MVSNSEYGTNTVNVTVFNVNTFPIANANLDQTVDEFTVVALEGKVSRDPDLDLITYRWEQTAGPSVALINDRYCAAQDGRRASQGREIRWRSWTRRRSATYPMSQGH